MDTIGALSLIFQQSAGGRPEDDTGQKVDKGL